MTPVDSRLRWNDCYVTVEKGISYDYRARGRWHDLWIGCGAKGYQRCWLSPFNRLKRYPDGDWFQLIACVERRRGHAFALVDAGKFLAPATGRLWLYSNDLPFMLWNNYGQLTFSIQPSVN